MLGNSCSQSRATCTRMRFADLDAVTIDAFGTLIELVDPVPFLADALHRHGIERAHSEIADAFAAEGRYYRAHIHEGADEDGLRSLQTRCAGVFLEAVGGGLDPGEFAPEYVACLHFKTMDGVVPALETLRARGLALAVVGNWDLTVHRWLAELGLRRYFSLVLHAARKPDPGSLRRALDELAVAPERALHVGDEPADEAAAAAAGARFPPAPLPAAVTQLA
jgi:FMN phosphatase YigB (HAD superfamily)